MTKNVLKYSVMIMAVILVIGLGFAGAASADGTIEVKASTWNSWSDDINTHIGDNDTVRFIDEDSGVGNIEPKFIGDTSGFTPEHDITFDFSKYHGTFTGVSGSHDGDVGSLFGYINDNSYGPHTIIIKNLTMRSVKITPDGYQGSLGGVIGRFNGVYGPSKLTFENCTLYNCSMGATSEGNNDDVGG